MTDAGQIVEPPASSVLQATREAILAIDESQRVILFNLAAERMFGWPAAQALGQSIDSFIPARHRGRHAEHVKSFGASGLAMQAMDERLPITALRSDGSEFPIAATISRAVVETPQGPRTMFLAMMRDISAQVSLQADLARATAGVRALVELTPVAIWIIDAGRIISVNRACTTLFGVEAAALVGAEYAGFIEASAQAVVDAADAALARPGSIVHVPAQVRRADGALRELEVAVTALAGQGLSTLQMALVDVTERHEEARALEATQRELRFLAARSVKAREEERRSISRDLHDDLGQRLTALKMALYADSLEQPAGRAGTGRPADPLRLVDDAIAALRRIASDLRPTMIDDLGLFPALEWLARSASEHLGIPVKLALPASCPKLSPEAAIAIYRIVQEALTNSARHSGAARVDVRGELRDGELLLTVQDNGRGFGPGDPSIAGSLGLLGMRERAQMAGGRVAFGKAPGGGARVTVHIPIALMPGGQGR